MSKFSDATFYLAPSGYKEGILFPQKPLSTNGEITFTRAGSAWRTNIEGQVEETCYNLLQYSEDITNAVWFSNGGTIVSNAGIAPDGTLTADSYTNSTYQIVRQLVTLSTNTTYTFSFYAKNVNATDAFYRVYNNTNATDVVSVTSFISQINTSTWSRVTLTFTTNTTGTEYAVYLCSGQQNGAILFWGSQLVRGSLPRPYLSTTNRQNFPRVDYSLGTGTFLLEPQRTNLMLNSGDFQNASWGKFGLTFNSTETAPDGTSSARNYSTTGAFAYALQTNTITSGSVYTSSVFLKYTSGVGSLAVRFTDSTSVNFVSVTVNLINGTIGTVSYGGNGANGSATITAFSNGWYRVTVSGSIVQTSGGFIVSNLGLGDTTFSIWGGQVEQGSYPTTYIPTTAATITRIADSFSRGNIFTNNLVSASGGTWFVDLKSTIPYIRDAFAQSIFIGGNSTGVGGDGFAFTFAGAGASQRPLIRKYVGAVESLVGTLAADNNKVIIKWNGSTADIFANGTKITSATPFAFTNLQFLGGSGNAAPVFVQQMALWNTPLTDAQCTDLTL